MASPVILDSRAIIIFCQGLFKAVSYIRLDGKDRKTENEDARAISIVWM